MERKKNIREGPQDWGYGACLKARRCRWNITLEQLCEGLCTVSMLTQIECGRKKPTKQLRERLLGRMGVSSDECETYVGYDEHTEWGMQQKILALTEQGNIIQAKECLEEYARKYGGGDFTGARSGKGDVASRLRAQFYLGMKGMCLKQQGVAPEKLADLFGEAVRMTMPQIDQRPVQELLLSQKEIDLVLEYENCQPAHEAVKKYYEVLDYLSRPWVGENSRAHNHAKTILYLCHALLMQEGISFRSYVQVFQVCDAGIKELQKTMRGHYLLELLDVKEQMIRQIMEQNHKNGEPQRAEALSGMLAGTREWQKIFGSLYERFCGPKMQWKGYDLYCGQDTYNIGEIIRRRRRMLGMGRGELSEGICSQLTLQRLETGRNSTQPAIVRALCERLGLSPEYERTELATADLRAHELEREIRYSVNAGRFEENLVQLEELKARIDMSIHINRQWVLCIEGMAKYRLGLICEDEYEEWLRQARECTLPTPLPELLDMEECYLTNSEMTCFYHYAFLGEKKDWQEAYGRMQPVYRVMQEFEEKGEEQCHIRSYELYMGHKAKLLHQLEEYEASERCARKVIRLCLRMGRLNILANALYAWVRNQMRMEKTEPGEAAYDWKKDLECCLALSRFCKDAVGEKFFMDVLEQNT